MEANTNWRGAAQGKRGMSGPMSRSVGGRTVPASMVSSKGTTDMTGRTQAGHEIKLGSLSSSPVMKKRRG